jgi:hypothetical protein
METLCILRVDLTGFHRYYGFGVTLENLSGLVICELLRSKISQTT